MHKKQMMRNIIIDLSKIRLYMIYPIKIIYFKHMNSLKINIINQIIVSFKLLMMKRKNQHGKQKLMILYFLIRPNIKC